MDTEEDCISLSSGCVSKESSRTFVDDSVQNSNNSKLIANKKTASQTASANYEPNVVLVQSDFISDHTEAQQFVSQIGGVLLDDSNSDSYDGLLRLIVIDGSSVPEAAVRISKFPGVQTAQPNFLYTTCSNRDAYTIVDDHWATNQWGLYFSDVPLAWDSVKVNHSVSVAVIDTGADLDHVDLSSNIVASYNSLSSAEMTYDNNGHGTHVAGIISGVANNEVGVAGVSYNANLVIIKASGYRDNSFDTASLVRAYRWLESFDESGMTVAQHYNVKVVNMSVGGWDDGLKANFSDDILHSAILKARDLHGILTVVAASNKGDDETPYFSYPGDSYGCLEVMNLSEFYDDDGNLLNVGLSESSNFNVQGTSYKDISAPGTSIYSTYPDNRYAIETGTSMAAPFVSGVAALVFAANPLLTPTQVQSILEASAMDMGDPGWDEKYGYGAVNVADAVALANTAIIKGWKAVAEWGTASFEALLGLGQGQVDGDWTWTVLGSDEDSGYATIDSSGILTGRDAGLVTVRATCHTKAGAEISQTMQVQVVDPEISGVETVGEGEVINLSTGYDDLTWSWVVEDGTGHATIDQEGHLTGVTAGSVTVRAICANNTDIVAETTVDVTAALALVA